MAKDVIITPLDGDIQFKNASSVDSGRIEQIGDDLAITNALGDVLIGDGSSDLYIGDGINSVDIVFDVNGSVRAEAGVTLTLGASGSTTAIAGLSLGTETNAVMRNTTTGALSYRTLGSNAFNSTAYLTSFTETDPTVPSHVKNITTGDISNWNTAYNNGLAGVSFDTSTGILSVSGQTGAYTADLDGRYLEAHPDTSTLSGTYGSTADGTKIDQITVDSNGHITAITTGNTGDILGVTAGTGLSGGGTSGTVTLNVSGLTTAQFSAATLLNSAEAFSSSDSIIMTSAAIEGYVTGLGYTSNIGDITGVTAGSGLSGGGTSGTVTLSHSDTSSQGSVNNSSGTVIQDVTLDTYGHVTALGSVNLDGRYYTETEVNTLLAGKDNYSSWSISDATTTTAVSSGNTVTVAGGTGINAVLSGTTLTISATNNGDITGVTAGTGLSGGGTSGTVTLNLDFSELTDMTADVAGTTELILQNGTVESRKAINEVKLSAFNNDAGWTSNTGDIEQVNAGSGLTGGGASGTVTLSHADTSSQASVDNSGGTVIQDVTLDTYGHITGLTSYNLDGRYFTESESDGRFVRKNVGYIWTSVGASALSFRSNDTIDTSTGDQASLEVYQDTAGADAFMQFHVSGDYAKYFGLHGGINDFVVGGWSSGASYQRMFHDGYHPNADKWTTARTLSLTGAVTGSASIDGSGNVSLATTATSDPTLTLSGDASGSATFTNLGNATLTVTVADDSHNHVISNIDGLQNALDGKDNYQNWVIADDGAATTLQVGSTSTLNIVGGTGITSSLSGNTLTISATNNGDITGVTAGTGLSGGGTSGSVTLAVDFSELSSNPPVTIDTTDQLIWYETGSGSENRTNISSFPLSKFNNDSGWTSNVGDITGVTAGSGLTGGGTSGTVTLSHSDTSSQGSVNNSGGTVIQDVTLDTYGHVTGLVSYNLDGRYYTETESDSRYLRANAADTATGLIQFNAGIKFGSTGETLDSYEEGSWTPIYASSSASVTSVSYTSVTAGRYIRVGNVVHCFGRIETNTITWSSTSGAVYIGGFPFPVTDVLSGPTFYAGSIGYCTNFTGEEPKHCGLNGEERLYLYYFSAVNSNITNTNVTDVGSGTGRNDCNFAVTYRTD